MNIRAYEPESRRLTLRLLAMEVVGSVGIALVLYLVGRGFDI